MKVLLRALTATHIICPRLRPTRSRLVCIFQRPLQTQPSHVSVVSDSVGAPCATAGGSQVGRGPSHVNNHTKPHLNLEILTLYNPHRETIKLQESQERSVVGGVWFLLTLVGALSWTLYESLSSIRL